MVNNNHFLYNHLTRYISPVIRLVLHTGYAEQKFDRNFILVKNAGKAVSMNGFYKTPGKQQSVFILPCGTCRNNTIKINST